ncbi:hypothetical protein D3C74_188900 [compost metagenome]
MNSQPSVEQLDLFGGMDFTLPPDQAGEVEVLNGMYYERSTGLFVSYVLGKRYFEVTAAECLGDKQWKENTMRERVI